MGRISNDDDLGLDLAGGRQGIDPVLEDAVEDVAEDVGEYAVTDVVLQVINVKGSKQSKAGHTSNKGYCPGPNPYHFLPKCAQMFLLKVSAFAPNFWAFMF